MNSMEDLNLSLIRPMATMALLLTPRVIRSFGADREHNTSATVADLYDEAIRRCFRPTARSSIGSGLVFEKRWHKRVLRFSKFYDRILQVFLSEAGPSRFKIEYAKQLSGLGIELEELGAAGHEVMEFFRRHLVCCARLGAGYEPMFASHTGVVDGVADLLWESNYGLTLLVLLLQRKLTSSLRVILPVNELTSRALTRAEKLLPRSRKQRLFGSLEISEGSMDLPDAKVNR